MYRNPVIPGFHPDPSVCRVGDDYYLVTSSFEYFPGLPLYHSRDLVHWRQLGHCLTRESQLPLQGVGSSEGIYAPTLRHHRGIFYLVATNVTRGGNFLISTTDPLEGWSEPVWLEQGGIDPSLHFAGEKVYLTSTNTGGAKHEAIPLEAGRYGIVQSELELSSGALLTRPRYLWSGTGGKCPEGPHLYKRGKFYYLLLAEGGTEYGHMVTIGRSKNPWGPFESCPHNPILTHRSREHPIQGTGHGDLIKAHDGSWWLVFLGFRPHGYAPCYHLGRETFLAPVKWTVEGWPIVGEGGVIELEVDAQTLPQQPWTPATTWDDFATPELDATWNFLRNPQAQDWSLTARPNWLQLRGSALTLDDHASPAFVGRRQQHFEVEVATLLEFNSQRDTDEAGLVVRMTEAYHYEMAVSQREGRRCVLVRRRVGSLVHEVVQDVPSGPVVLIVKADHSWYTFGYRMAEMTETCWLTRGETKLLSAEVAGSFMGVYFGLYATGNGHPCMESAFFDWFMYIPKES